MESNVVPLRQELNRVKEAHSKERMGRLSAQQEISVLKDQVVRLEKINEGGLHTYIHTYKQIYAFNLFNILRLLYVPICSYSIVYTYLHHAYIHMYIYKWKGMSQSMLGLVNENKVVPGLVESNEILKNDIAQLRRRFKEEKTAAQKQIQMMESQGM